MRKGLPVSPGVAVGTAYCIHQIFVDPRARTLAAHEVRDELQRYEEAVARTETDLRALYHKVLKQVGQKEAAIFQVHQAILHDSALTAKVRDWVTQNQKGVEGALAYVLDEYTRLFSDAKDDLLRERLADVRDVIIRISGHLSKVLQSDDQSLPGPLILVVEELLPSQVVTLGQKEVAGIVTQTGGQTSHAAILARSRAIPAVSGVSHILRQVKNGDTLVVDGREGHVIINPDSETESAYRKLQREFVDLKDQLAENHDHPAVTADGISLDLLANINNPRDARVAKRMGASGVGLYRTEYLFLTHPDVPSESEQLAAYREVIAESPNHRVTIRTLDLGGDKTVAYLGHSREANPFMGWRSIRLSFEHPDFFATQIRAVLRAAATTYSHKPHVRLMFPMITTLEEIRRVRRMVKRAQHQLEKHGHAYCEVEMGLMLEVPAAAVCIENLLHATDFVSIGSNDLVQYLMAADRDNPKVSHLCQPLAPAVLRVLTRVIQACNAANKPVTLCGEMAGSYRSFLLLLGMGLRSFSMSPAFIPAMKQLATRVTIPQAEKMLEKALTFKSIASVQKYMASQVQDLCPDLKLLDTM